MIQETFLTTLLLRWLVITAAILLASSFFPGVHVASVPTAFLAAAILGILNTFLRPVLLLLTLPLTVLTLGIFAFVLNALLLLLVAYFVPGLEIESFSWAFLGALMISLASWLANRFIYRPTGVHREKPDVIDLERGDDGKWR
jgi:putative membrane protein